MTAEQFWDGEAWLGPYYRKAYELRREAENESMWIQGAYIRDAILNAMQGKKCGYPEEPYLLNTSFSDERKKKQEEREERKATDSFMLLTQQWNMQFENKNK